MQPPQDTGPSNKQAPIYNPGGQACPGCAGENEGPPTAIQNVCANCARPLSPNDPKIMGASGATYCSTNCMMNRESETYVP